MSIKGNNKHSQLIISSITTLALDRSRVAVYWKKKRVVHYSAERDFLVTQIDKTDRQTHRNTDRKVPWPLLAALLQVQVRQASHTRAMAVAHCLVTSLVTATLSGDRLAVECWFPSFALLVYRVTNQIYIYVSRKSSSANLSQSECPIRHCLISELALLDFRVGAAWFPSYIYKKFDWSLCNQAVQNSEINILPRVSPLTVSYVSRVSHQATRTIDAKHPSHSSALALFPRSYSYFMIYTNYKFYTKATQIWTVYPIYIL